MKSKVLILSFLTFFLLACKKDNNYSPHTATGLRITKITSIYSDKYEESTFHYNNCQLMEVRAYRSNELGEHVYNGNYTFRYEGNEVIIDNNTHESDAIFQSRSERKYEIINGKVVGCTSLFGGRYCTIIYSGSKIVEVLESNNDEYPNELIDYKLSFAYTDDFIKEVNAFSLVDDNGNWLEDFSQVGKQVRSYKNSKLASDISYGYNELGELEKEYEKLYQFIDELTLEETFNVYGKGPNTIGQVIHNETAVSIFNKQGLLTERKVYDQSGNLNLTILIKYEAKQGNEMLLLLPPHFLLLDYPYKLRL